DRPRGAARVAAVRRGRGARLRVVVLKGQDGPLHAHHRANKGIDDDQQHE
ncbi:MAG: hypothetical protein QG549_76, partial [Patescibacteria group bacterium]|nr:hypothetical protein [Patescibacteria group bacterium]